MKVYIKFRHPDAIYLLDPLYDLQEIVLPKTCGKCEENLHVPIDRDFVSTISRGMGDVIFKRDMLFELVSQSFPEGMVIKSPYRVEAMQRKHLETLGYAGLLMVEEKHIHLSVHDISKEPVRCTVCFPKEELNLCEHLERNAP